MFVHDDFKDVKDLISLIVIRLVFGSLVFTSCPSLSSVPFNGLIWTMHIVSAMVHVKLTFWLHVVGIWTSPLLLF